jgi:MarR family transcriptional regulator, organic hydroperoxide resistance regulator
MPDAPKIPDAKIVKTQDAGGEFPDNFDVEEMLCFTIYSSAHAFNRVYKPLLQALGLTYPQYLVMRALWVRDDQTVGALGDKLLLESSTLTPLLKRLEGLGYVSRNRDPTDERQVRVRLTAPGEALRTQARAIPACVLDATGLTLEGMGRLRDEVAAMRSHLLESAEG